MTVVNLSDFSKPYFSHIKCLVFCYLNLKTEMCVSSGDVIAECAIRDLSGLELIHTTI